MTPRLVLCAYVCFGLVLAAAGRAWLALPLCMIALLATGELWLRALTGPPRADRLPRESGLTPPSGMTPPNGLPASRLGFAAVAGLATLPLVALGLHAVGAPVRPLPLVIGSAAVVTVLGGTALIRERLARRRLPAQRAGDAERASDRAGTARSGFAPTRVAVAVTVPAVLVLAVGGVAVRAYLASPRPAQPGYLSVALGGWAADIDRPVTVSARGLSVPVRVASSGLGPTTTLMRVTVGGLLVGSRPVTVAADSENVLSVRVPAPPPDGCLRAISISVGATSAGFYASRPAAPGRAAC